jgi:hypothetical protein
VFLSREVKPVLVSGIRRNFGGKSLASQSIPSWNQIIDWLKEMEMLRQVAA